FPGAPRPPLFPYTTLFRSNPDILVYDTSGVYTDPNLAIDLNKGLPNVREAWIEERQDTERLETLTSKFGQERLKDIRTAEIRFRSEEHTSELQSRENLVCR